MHQIKIEVLNRTDIRRRDLEKSDKDEHVYDLEKIPMICKGCTTVATPLARPMLLKTGDVFTLAYDQSKREIILTGQRQNSDGKMPIYFKLAYIDRLPGLQPFEVTALQCRIKNPNELGQTIDHILMMLGPRQGLPHWEPHTPLDRATNFSTVTNLTIGITATKKQH